MADPYRPLRNDTLGIQAGDGLFGEAMRAGDNHRLPQVKRHRAAEEMCHSHAQTPKYAGVGEPTPQ